MTIRIRRNVNTTAGATALEWYARAVEVMLQRGPDDPTSWTYRAAVHGTGATTNPRFWDRCEHSSWQFLPWHRAYLASFEAMVAEAVAGLNGPQEWALPYWDYTADLATHPDARRLPAAFRDRQTPDGRPNVLHSARSTHSNGDFGLTDDVVSVRALEDTSFEPSRGEGFGGGPFPARGAIEGTPHNQIHRRIGGYMGAVDTAGLDPIFWLHHCNIDRLWEQWRALNPHVRHPDTAEWTTASYEMHDGFGRAFLFAARDMLSTEEVLHGYRYDDVPVAVEPPLTMGFMVEGPTSPPDLAGTSVGSIPLEGDVTTASVEVNLGQAGVGFVSRRRPDPEQVLLKLENVTGWGAPNDYQVYVHVPGGERHRAGVLTTFGIERASDPQRDHGGGSGLTEVLDITHLASVLGLTIDAPTPTFEVDFDRDALPPLADERPAAMPDGPPPVTEGSVTVGRIGLYVR